MGKLWRQRVISALPRPSAPQAIGICHVAIATPAASKPVCRATHVIRPIPASSNRHSWPRGFLPRGLYDVRPSWSLGCHWHACAGGHPTNLNDSGPTESRPARQIPGIASSGPTTAVWSRIQTKGHRDSTKTGHSTHRADSGRSDVIGSHQPVSPIATSPSIGRFPARALHPLRRRPSSRSLHLHPLRSRQRVSFLCRVGVRRLPPSATVHFPNAIELQQCIADKNHEREFGLCLHLHG
jgi:hypothetical protein